MLGSMMPAMIPTVSGVTGTIWKNTEDVLEKPFVLNTYLVSSFFFADRLLELLRSKERGGRELMSLENFFFIGHLTQIQPIKELRISE